MLNNTQVIQKEQKRGGKRNKEQIWNTVNQQQGGRFKPAILSNIVNVNDTNCN